MRKDLLSIAVESFSELSRDGAISLESLSEADVAVAKKEAEKIASEFGGTIRDVRLSTPIGHPAHIWVEGRRKDHSSVVTYGKSVAEVKRKLRAEFKADPYANSIETRLEKAAKALEAEITYTKWSHEVFIVRGKRKDGSSFSLELDYEMPGDDMVKEVQKTIKSKA